MAQYFDNVDLPSNIVEFNTNFYGVEYKFKTDNGVFSKNNIDFGTRFLLETIPLKDIKGDVLDVGCGYGPISIVLGKMLDIQIDGVDVNKRAIHLGEMNKKLNNVYNANFFISDCYEKVNKKYDVIITNPPIRAGKDVVYKIFDEAKDHLKENGCLYIVIRKEQGAKSAIEHLKEKYKVEILDKKSGYFVIKCN
jgi:16S rRNA (guanine1207-N2)-methyltransferase